MLVNGVAIFHNIHQNQGDEKSRIEFRYSIRPCRPTSSPEVFVRKCFRLTLEDILQLMEFRKKRWPRLKAGCLAPWRVARSSQEDKCASRSRSKEEPEEKSSKSKCECKYARRRNRAYANADVNEQGGALGEKEQLQMQI